MSLVSIIALFGFMIGCVSTSGHDEQASFDNDLSYDTTWIEPHTKVFSQVGPALKPSETLELLKVLDEKYKIRKDEDSIKKHEQVVELLEVSRVEEEKCLTYYTEYKILQEMLDDNWFLPNLVDYLQHYNQELFKLCNGHLLKFLKQDVAKLPEGTEGFLELLKQVMAAASAQESKTGDYLIHDTPTLTRGIVLFLEKTSSLGGKEQAQELFKEYDLSIRKPCMIVKKTIQSSIAEFEMLRNSDQFVNQFDPLAIEWLDNYDVCMSIVGRGKAYSTGLGLNVATHISKRREL